MKIRQGFVSNSSSSSFVVAFSKKPKNANEVLKLMFGGKDGFVNCDYYDTKLSYKEAAERVFEDIKKIKKHIKIKDIAEILHARYHYCLDFYNPEHSMDDYMGIKRDNLGGYWHCGAEKYFGKDSESLEKLRQLIYRGQRAYYEIQKKQLDIIEKCPVRKVKYAYQGGKDSKTGKPYTKKQIKDFKKYEDEREEYKKNHAEYQKLEKERLELVTRDWKEESDLRNKIATADAGEFVNDNKGSFIFTVEYSDNDTQEDSMMEHGDIFANVPHITISNH